MVYALMFHWMQFENSLLRILMSMFIREIGLCVCCVLVWFWYQSNTGLIEWVWECCFPFCLKDELEECWCQFLRNLAEFSNESIWSWTSLHWEDFHYSSILLLIIDLFKLLIASWFNFGRSYAPRILSNSSKLSSCTMFWSFKQARKIGNKTKFHQN